MRIVHLVSSARLGGTEASLIEMLASLRDSYLDWSLHVIVPEEGPLRQRLQQMKVSSEVLRFPPALARLGEAGHLATAAARALLLVNLLRALPSVVRHRSQLRRAILRHAEGGAIDIMHAHGFKMQVLSASIASGAARLIWHLHDYISSRPVSAVILRRLVRRTTQMIANSESVAADARAVFGPGRPLATIYNAVNLDRFHPAGPVLDLDACGGAQPAPAGTIRIGLMATFGLWKGHETFLAAVARLPPELSIRAYIIGGPQYQTTASEQTYESLQQTAASLGIEDRVVFTGPVMDSAAALRALDVVVHASTEPEPFGMVIAEAMACGRAVVVSMAGGAAELIRERIDGLGHAPGDAAQLARCLEELVRDGGHRGRIGRAARESAEQRFDHTRLAGQLAAVYRQGT